MRNETKTARKVFGAMGGGSLGAIVGEGLGDFVVEVLLAPYALPAATETAIETLLIVLATAALGWAAGFYTPPSADDQVIA